MIILLSPAKSLDFENRYITEFSTPYFHSESATIASNLKKKSANGLKKLMSISDNLAQLNYTRYQTFETEADKPEIHNAAIHAFRGDVYVGLNVDDFNKNELKRAQKQLRILSGLYGYLKPMDIIQPYRLEMGTRLKISRASNLYEFWGSKITDKLNEELSTSKPCAVINLASKEYFKSINKYKVQGDIYDIHFKEMVKGELKFVSFNAKKARGMMARYILKENVKTVPDLVHFNYDRYTFEPSLSNEKSYTFIR